MKFVPLPDGSHLEVDSDDEAWGIDSELGETLRWHAEDGTLRTSAGVVRRTITPASTTTKNPPRHRGGGKSKASPARGCAADGKTVAGQRFATLNEFVDTVARHLTAVETVVWFTMFRDCQGGRASVSNRDIACRSGCSLRAVTAAVQRLRKAGLIEPVTLSKHRGQASVYAMHPKPSMCVTSIVVDPSRAGAAVASVQHYEPCETGACDAPG
jgi:hypothetical protein